MKNKSTLFLVQAALIAAVYVVLTLVFAPFSYGEIQVRYPHRSCIYLQTS